MSIDSELSREISQVINLILQEAIQMERERQYNEQQIERSKLDSEKAELVKKMNDSTQNSVKKMDNLLKQNEELVTQYGVSIGGVIDEDLSEAFNNEVQSNLEMQKLYNREQENLWPDEVSHTDLLALSRPALNAYTEICKKSDEELASPGTAYQRTKPMEAALLETIANKDYPEKAEDLEKISWHWMMNKDILDTLKDNGLGLGAAQYTENLRINFSAVEDKTLMESGENTIEENTEQPELREEPAVQSIFGALNENDPFTKKAFEVLLTCVSAMEEQVKDLSDETIILRQQISEMQTSPEKALLEQQNQNMEKQVVEIQQEVIGIKERILINCRETFDNFKQQGKQALKGVIVFLHIDNALEKVQKHVENSLKENDRTLKAIETIAEEYHKAGQHLKNTTNLIFGKEAEADIKGPGIISKSITAHFTAEQSYLNKLKNSVEKAITSINNLSPQETEEEVSGEPMEELSESEDTPITVGNLEESILEAQEKTSPPETAQNNTETNRERLSSEWANMERIDLEILAQDNAQDNDMER